jgi:hypothetical protein
MTGRYRHVPTEVLTGTAEQVTGLLWQPASDGGDDSDGRPV